MRSPVIKIEDGECRDRNDADGGMNGGSGEGLFHNTRLRFHTKRNDRSISNHMLPSRQSPIANFRTLTTPIPSSYPEHNNP